VRALLPSIHNLFSLSRMVRRGAEAAAGLLICGAATTGCTHQRNVQAFNNAGITPNPPVSSLGTTTLISANDALREYGPYALGIGIAVGAAYSIFRRRPTSRLAAMHDITHQTKRWPRVVFTGVVMGIVASASGLGDTASQGASEPVRAMATMLNTDFARTPIVTSYANTPYNYSGINFQAVQNVIAEAGGTAVPFLQNLGEVKNPVAESNPSSAPIFAVPNEVLQRSLGVSLPEITDCGDLSVVVGKQLGVPVGGVVTINDQVAEVGAVVDMKPGLDRVAVIGSTEQMAKCVYPGQPMTGAVALGLDGDQAGLQQAINEILGVSYAVRSFEQFQDDYHKFWDGSVKPPEMNLIFDVLLAGAIALISMQISEILRRRKNIAMLLSQGVDRKHLSWAYAIAAQNDTLFAVPVAAVTATVFTILNNSSQFGLAEAVNVSSLGAGYVTLAAVTLISSIIGNRVIKRTEVTEHLRSSV
jgi:hypothetical protein